MFEDHVTDLFVAFDGDTVAVSVCVSPTVSDKLLLFRLTPVTATFAAETATLQVAVLDPSAVLTVIVAVPAAFAVTRPDEETVATDVLLEDHVTFLFVAFDGDIVAAKVSVLPTVMDKELLFRVTPVTATVAAVTVTLQVAVLDPSTVFTVIVAVPVAFAVTTPEEETVATDVLLDDHVTFLFVAFDGETVAINVSESPTVSDKLLLFRPTPVTATVAAVTVTLQVAVLDPSTVFTVIVAVPAAFAVTRPEEDTVATAVLPDDHVTFLFVAFDGATVAVSVSVSPTVSDKLLLFSVTPVTATVASVTVTLHVAVLDPSAVLTVIVAEPAAFAVTRPEEETVATDILLDDHVTFLFVAFDGETVAVNVSESPTVSDKLLLFKPTPVTATVAAVTVTLHVAVLDPSAVLTVIVAVPAAFAVTRPEDDTVATDVLLDDQATLLSVAFSGNTFADNKYVSPSVNDNVFLSRVISVTFTSFTVTEQEADTSPTCKVIIASPGLTPLTSTPPCIGAIVATVLLDDDHFSSDFRLIVNAFAFIS